MCELMLWPFLIFNEFFLHKGFGNPRLSLYSSLVFSWKKALTTYFVDVLSVSLIETSFSDMCESRKKTFCEVLHR